MYKCWVNFSLYTPATQQRTVCSAEAVQADVVHVQDLVYTIKQKVNMETKECYADYLMALDGSIKFF